jgi:hypothetical protein
VRTVHGERGIDLGPLWVPERAMRFPDEGRDFIERAFFEVADSTALADYGLPRGARFAESFPFEGLDVVINTLVRKSGTTMPDPGFLFLFTSQTPTTVPGQTAVLATSTGVTEATGGGYARASIPGTTWPAPATADTTGRRSTVASPGVSFAESTGAYSVTNVNGFGLATAASAGVAVFYANFDSGAAIVVNQAGFTVRIPPYIQFSD